MSSRKVRTKIRGRPAEETDHPDVVSVSSGQTKVIEYFPTVHRDSAKKFKNPKLFTENDKAKATEHVLESPKKMARLKSPETSEKKTESDRQEWVLPITSNNVEDKCGLEVTKNKGLSARPVGKTDLGEVRKKTYDKIKRGTMKVDSTVSSGTETNKADSVDLSNSDVLPSAVKLVESSDSSSIDTLPLPAKFERLLRLFDYTEMVVSWLETQGKRITLNEVMTNVQRKLKSIYDERHFAMILSVYPESYNIRCERRWMPIGGRHCCPKEFEYVIEPNLINDLILPQNENVEETSLLRASPRKQGCSSPSKASLISLSRSRPTASNFTVAAPKSPSKSFSESNLVNRCPPKLESRRLYRKLEFKSRLRKLVNVHHAAFLKNEGIEISSDEQLLRYHPDFDLDAVTDITPVELPEMPQGDAGQPETMREYLKAVPDSSNTLPERIKMVIKELRSPEKKVAVVADKCIPLSPKKYVEAKNISKPSLLERIRAKEQQRKRREMFRNPEMEQRKGRLERISHSLLQCICSYYNLKKVGSMKFVELVDKLAFGIGIISKVEIEAAIGLLCEVCPSYCEMVEVRGEKYVHLKDNNFSAIRDIVNLEIKKCI